MCGFKFGLLGGSWQVREQIWSIRRGARAKNTLNCSCMASFLPSFTFALDRICSKRSLSVR